MTVAASMAWHRLVEVCDPAPHRVEGDPLERLAVFCQVAEHGASSSAIVRLARVLERNTARATAEAVARYVQLLPYVPDAVGPVDEVRDPCAVLAFGGDCDDLACLALALDLALGLRSRLAWLVQAGASQDHVSPQVHVDGRWIWQEVTVGALVGEHPYDAVARVGGADRVEGRR